MRHWLTGIVMAWLLPLAAAAEDTALRSLETTEQGRDWDAVGRLDIGGTGFCTGALIAPDLVLTAAHCLFDKSSKARIPTGQIEFLAGFRNGRASAYRYVRRAVIHPDYVYDGDVTPERVRSDVALLELQRPIRNTSVIPFQTGARPARGSDVGVVSYAKDRPDAPALQEVCGVKARQQGILVMSCDVDYGSSGAPIFSFDGDVPRIVSVVSAKANVRGERVALGTELSGPLEQLRAELSAGPRFVQRNPGGTSRVVVGGARNSTGAKFVKP